MRTLVSRIAFHLKGARRASICSSMSGDIGVDAVDPAERVREGEQELVMVGEMPVERSDSFECLDQVRFQTARGPHSLHRRRGDPRLRRHRPARPVGLAVRRGMPCQVHDLVDLLLRDCGLPATPGPDLPQLRQALLGEPGPPRPNRRRLHPYLRGDPHVRHAIGRQQQRLRPLNLPMRRGLRPRQGLQRFSLTVRHDQSSCWCHHLRSLSQN